MMLNITLNERKDFLSEYDDLQKNWKSLITKKTESRIFYILTAHHYTFDFKKIPSDNEYGLWWKKLYTDSSFRWAISQISTIKKSKYLQNSTIQKIIKSVEWMRKCEAILNTNMTYSDPATIPSTVDIFNEYAFERRNNAKISGWEVYPPGTTEEEIKRKDEKYWNAPLLSSIKEETVKNKEEKKLLIDKHWQLSLDFWFMEDENS